MYCSSCDKEVVFIGLGIGTASTDEVEALVRSVEAEGKLALLNAPPFGPHHCPECQAELVELPGRV